MTIDIKQAFELVEYVSDIFAEFKFPQYKCHIKLEEHEDEDDCYRISFSFEYAGTKYEDVIIFWETSDFEDILRKVSRIKTKAIYLIK